MQTRYINAECRDCVFYDPYEAEAGVCHRFPRHEDKDAGDFCGEFDPGPGEDEEYDYESPEAVDEYFRGQVDSYLGLVDCYWGLNDYYQNDTGGCRIELDEDDDYEVL